MAPEFMGLLMAAWLLLQHLLHCFDASYGMNGASGISASLRKAQIRVYREDCTLLRIRDS